LLRVIYIVGYVFAFLESVSAFVRFLATFVDSSQLSTLSKLFGSSIVLAQHAVCTLVCQARGHGHPWRHRERAQSRRYDYQAHVPRREPRADDIALWVGNAFAAAILLVSTVRDLSPRRLRPQSSRLRRLLQLRVCSADRADGRGAHLQTRRLQPQAPRLRRLLQLWVRSASRADGRGAHLQTRRLQPQAPRLQRLLQLRVCSESRADAGRAKRGNFGAAPTNFFPPLPL